MTVKPMEGVAHSRLEEQIQEKLDPRQYAREGHSTTDTLIYMLHAIHEATDRRNCGARMFFADYSKGFDLIDHSILLRELAFFHIDTVLINWIRAFLTGRWKAVRIGNSLSERKSPRGDQTGCDLETRSKHFILHHGNTVEKPFLYTMETPLTHLFLHCCKTIETPFFSH